MLNIVCTSKPADGLLFYSYEYCSHLNEKGIRAQVYVVTHRDFTSGDYTQAISDKYIHCENIVFNNDYVEDNCISLIMGRSMLTLAHMAWNDYRPVQQESLKKLFGNKLISVYSENHPEKYPLALEFFNPKKVIDLCDTDVYPNGVGEHFEKIIHFPIYKEVKEDIQFDHLFLGTNPEYYKTVQKVIDKYPDHGILTYPHKYLDLENNNLRCPVDNLLGKFKTYVYTKDTFDPAPRLFQEARWLGKEIIYLRNDDVKDGGYWYWKRGLKQQDLSAMITAIDEMNGKIALETDLAVRKVIPQIGNLPTTKHIEIKLAKEALIEKIENDDIWYCTMPWLMAFTDEMGDYAQCNFGWRLPKYENQKTLFDTSIKEWMTGNVMNNIREEMVDTRFSKFSNVKNLDYVSHHCRKCIKDELELKTSRRMIATKIYSKDPAIWNTLMEMAFQTNQGNGYQFMGRVLEIQVKSFGIECNLDCHMCRHFSSSIRTTMAFGKNKVWNDVVWGDKDKVKDDSDRASKTKPVDVISNEILELAPYIFNLKIIGGEPLIMKKHYELFDKLIEIDEAKNIQIKYQTNATQLKAGKHNVLKYIPHFKNVLVVVSLDSVGKQNDYIRRRSDWNQILKNIKEFKKFDNVDLDINSVVTFFSVFNLWQLEHYFPSPPPAGYEDDRTNTYHKNWWNIDNPSQFKANNLPEKIKKHLIPKYEDIDCYKGIVEILKLPQEPDFNPIELYKYITDTDKAYIGTKWEMDFLDVFPELMPHYYASHKNGHLGVPQEYAKRFTLEMPEISGLFESIRECFDEITSVEPERWYEGIDHYPIVGDKCDAIYDFVNKSLFHQNQTPLALSYNSQLPQAPLRPSDDHILDPKDILEGKWVSGPRAFLSIQKGGVDFIPHIDSGFVFIFPYEIADNSNYKLQYLNEHDEIIYEYKYRYQNDSSEVVGILHNGAIRHTVRYESPKDKWWIQLILNPLIGGWKELCEHHDNKNLLNYKGKENGPIRITR